MCGSIQDVSLQQGPCKALPSSTSRGLSVPGSAPMVAGRRSSVLLERIRKSKIFIPASFSVGGELMHIVVRLYATSEYA